MRERHMPASDAVYRPLKAFVSKRGGLRLSMHGGMRDRLIELVVEEWPRDCPAGRIDDVVRARVSRRLRQQYGSVVAMFLLSALASAIIKIVIEWWFSRDSHRVLMDGWAGAAQNPDV